MMATRNLVRVLIVPLWNWNVRSRTYNPNKGYVLIVPLWNWNKDGSSDASTEEEVLIVPLWNWNGEKSGDGRQPSVVLIVPLWNWNRPLPLSKAKAKRSNCTFMELKSASKTFWLGCLAF